MTKKVLTGWLAALAISWAAASQPLVPDQPDPARMPEDIPETAPAQPPGAEGEEPQAAEPPDSIRKAYGLLLPLLTNVRIEIAEDPLGAYESRSPIERTFDAFVRQRLPLRVCGLRIDPQGTILIPDINLPLDRYAGIAVTTHDGRSTVYSATAVLENFAAILLTPVETPDQIQPAAEFVSSALEAGDVFLMGRPAFLEDSLGLRIDRETAATAAVSDKDVRILWWEEAQGNPTSAAIPVTAPLILNAEAELIGIGLHRALWQLPGGNNSWIGTDIIADRRIARKDLDRIESSLQFAARASIKEVALTFRPDSSLNQKLTLEDGRYFSYGLLMDDRGTILVPTGFGREVIGHIESIAIIEESGAVEARFVGLFSDFGAFLLRAGEATGQPARLSETGAIPRGRIFYGVSANRRYGRPTFDVEYNRYLDVLIGYKGQTSPVPRKPMSVGDFAVNEQGEFLGFVAPAKRETRDELQERLLREGGAAAHNRLYLFAELEEQLRRPAQHFDASAQPGIGDEQRRFVWLGVEYQPMTADLARMMKIEQQTRDGARGLLVNHVYPGSPAESLGIRPNDVLLAIQVPGATGEFDLAPKGKWRQMPRATDFADGIPKRLWRPRRNYLTELLRLVGPGRTVGLRTLQNGNTRVVQCELEAAPNDFDTATEYTDIPLGLTVKDITYEVRHALRLSSSANGVVISRVQPGGQAVLSHIRPYELIAAVNGRAVNSIEEVERIMRDAAADGRVELLLFFLGETRIVEVEFD